MGYRGDKEDVVYSEIYRRIFVGNKMEIKSVKVDKIRPYEHNPRKNDDAVKLVANSIREFGWKQPIVVDKDGVIVAGHTRYKAALQLGMDTVPCLIADDLSPEQIRAYRLADNKTNDAAEWDFDELDLELSELDGFFDMADFGFDDGNDGDDFFFLRERNDTSREEGNEEYNNFLDKFEAKKTTDDCYTPDVVYDAVAGWVEKEYGLSKSDFVRPFFPGGDYQRYKYKTGTVVVDNPPFSILAEICRFYTQNGVKFFLFAPSLTLFSSMQQSCCALCTGVSVTYENGAVVGTSFLTNLETGLRLRSAPGLYAAVHDANNQNLKEMRRELTKYTYPDYVITSTRVGQFSRYGIDFRVPINESAFIRQLDAQKESGNGVFGSAYLVSERIKRWKEKAEREKAEREKAERFQLSAREMGIVHSLSESDK